MTRIAIACQGGGSHTAFTAGVLGRLLGADELADHEVVGISGTSGGAICALIAWSALRDGDRAGAAARLEGFWRDNAAVRPDERLLNAWMVGAGVLQGLSLLPSVTPYAIPPWLDGTDQFRALLRRHVDVEGLTPDADEAHPLLLLGAVDVLTGEFRTFSSREDVITPDSVLASAAIPRLFRSVHTNGGVFWDGLFSQNPPVKNLLVTEPDELWVIQINPSRIEREPVTLTEIDDRRNALGGNLSLYQELGFVETVDELLEAGHLDPASGYRQIRIRVLEMPSDGAVRSLLGSASKLNRDWTFLRGLLAEGDAQAATFLAAWEFEQAWRAGDVDALAALLGPDVEIDASDPFPPCPGSADRRRYLCDLLDGHVSVDATRKQVVDDTASWRVRRRTPDGAVVPARAELSFRDGAVRHARLRR